jgi:hypothetical protein
MKVPDTRLTWDMAIKLHMIEEIYEHRYSRGRCECCTKEIFVNNYDIVFEDLPPHKLPSLSMNRLRTYRDAIVNIFNGNQLRKEDRAWCHLCSFECTEAIHPSTGGTNE